MPRTKVTLDRSSSFPYGEPQADAALVQACLSGDQAAWRALVQRYAGLVYSVPMRLGLDEDSSDDVFQMVFEVLLKQLPKLRDPRTLPKWFLTAAQRISWKYIRQSKRLLNAAPPGDAINPTEQLIQWERQHLVRTALDRLGGRCRELLTALYLGHAESSYDQVASDLGLPVGSIGPMRARCIQKLVQLLRENLGE